MFVKASSLCPPDVTLSGHLTFALHGAVDGILCYTDCEDLDFCPLHLAGAQLSTDCASASGSKTISIPPFPRRILKCSIEGWNAFALGGLPLWDFVDIQRARAAETRKS